MSRLPLESQKKELLLAINPFNKPAELIGKNAWSQLIMYLLFLEPGTYPSMPEMGIGIKQYDFSFMDDAIEELPSKINQQVSLFLPDVPLTNVDASKVVLDDGRVILLLVLTFSDNGNVDSTAIASTVKRSLLDFEPSWING